MSSVERKARELLADQYENAGMYETSDGLRSGLEPDVHGNLALRAIAAALREHPEARGVVDGVPAFQRWSMARGSDGKRWSVYMDHDQHGEWVKWVDVQQHFFGLALTAAQQPVQEGGGECPKCRGTGEVCTGYIDGTPEMFDCTCPAAAPPSAPVGEAYDDGPGPVQVPGWAWASVENFVTIADAFRQSAGPHIDAINEGGDAGEDEISEVFDGALNHVKRAVAALAQQPAQAAPGWKLVPVVATPEMLEAATGLFKSVGLYGCYNAMLAAAPAPPGDDAAGGGFDDPAYSFGANPYEEPRS